MARFRCKCGRFVGSVCYTVMWDESISDVRGECAACGEVEIEEWDYESLIGEGEEDRQEVRRGDKP